MFCRLFIPWPPHRPERLLFTILLCQFFCVHFATSQNTKFPKMVFDMTKHLDEIISGKISRQVFSSKLNSNPVLPRDKLQSNPVSLLYATGCNILESEQCTHQIKSIAQLVNETFEDYVKTVDLTISLTVDVPTIIQLSELESKTIELLELPIKVLVNLHENTKCEDLEKIGYGAWDKIVNTNRWVSMNPSTKAGFGYTEALILCKGQPMIQAINKADFLVLNMKFGNTIGVTESFGLFKRRMDALHEDNLKFIKNNLYFTVNKTPKPVYYPNPHSVGYEGHRRLLMQYAGKWTTASNNGDRSMVIQTPYFEQETVNENLPVIPTVQSNSCGGFDSKIHNLMWYVPSALAEISKYFKSVVLKHDHWKALSSEKVRNLYNSIKTPDAENIRLDVILDYSDTLVHHDEGLPALGTCSYNWNQIEKELAGIPIEQLQNVKPKLLLFQISNIGTIKMRAHAPLDFAERVSSKYKMGCTYWKNSFSIEMLNESVATDVVNACKQIDGTIYVFKSDVNLESRNLQQNYLLHYEDSVRKELEAANMFRKHILAKNPNAVVYFNLNINPTRQLYIRENYQVTAFCNPAVFEGNVYLEAIVNWAKLNDFPLIMKTAFDYLEQPEFSGWLSFLRPVNILNQKEDEEGQPPSVPAQYPSFVLRNYPQGFNNWTVDPCIEWTHDRPNIGVDYFHNQHIGAILNTGEFEKNEESDEIMLHFVVHRFHSTEIVIGKNGLGVLKALKSLTSKDLIGANLNLFISYDPPAIIETENTKFLKETKIPSIKGLHVDLKNIRIMDEKLEAGFLETWISSVKPMGFKVGIVLISSDCMDIAGLIIARDVSPGKILKLLQNINYIVCNHELEVLSQDDQKHLGNLFDTHLYLKRIFKRFQPHLKLYFRIELKLDLNEDTDTMNRYLRVISHFNKFGSAYDIKYFLVEAFDKDSETGKNGWWAIKNYTKLDDPYAYVEKESVYSGRSMWYPPLPANTRIVKESSATTAVIATVSSILLLLFVGISGFLYLRYKKLSNFLTKEEVEEFLNGKQNPKNDNAVEEAQSASAAEYMKFKTDYDLPKMDLIIDLENVLGAGNFGTVYKGTAKGMDAAIKKPNKDCPKGTFKSVLTEIKVLCYIGNHLNVVGFYGAYTKEINKGILFVATELCSNGSLESYLRKKKQVVARQEESVYQNTQLADFLYYHELHGFSNDIANGMAYIESKHVVHGDLSARNVLLDENFNCKIGDFGLSRKLYEYQKYVKKSQEPLPWKWMAYESLTKMEFTSKSDVWSYGVTLFEMYSLGGSPYGGLNWTMGFADELRNGLRLTRPQFASEEIYAKMLECWHFDVEQRPSFLQLAEFFKQFRRADYVELCE